MNTSKSDHFISVRKFLHHQKNFGVSVIDSTQRAAGDIHIQSKKCIKLMCSEEEDNGLVVFILKDGTGLFKVEVLHALIVEDKSGVLHHPRSITIEGLSNFNPVSVTIIKL